MTKKTPRRRPPLGEAALRALYDCSPIGIAELDSEGRFTSANKALQRMLGRTEARLRRLTFGEITHPDDAASCAADFLGLVEKKTDHFECEKRFLLEGGGTVWAHTIVMAVRSGRGRSMVGMAIDVTARRSAQDGLRRLKADLETRVDERTAALSRQAAMLKAQMEGSADGILIVDPEGRIVSRNARFGELWRIPAEVLERGSDEEAVESVLSGLADPDAFLERVRHLYSHPEESSLDRLELRDGRVFERHSSPVVGTDGRYYGRAWRFRDITERERADREIREKNEALARSNAELEMYAYAASHDLSAPLRKIIAFGDLLEGRAKSKLDEAERDYLHRMQKASAAALKLVGDMLLLSRVGRDALPAEEVDLNAVLAEARAEAGEDMRLEAPRLPVVRAHAPLLHALLFNLLSNCVKFRRADVPLVVKIDARSEGGEFVFAVSDNGIGFDREYAEKIFHPFLRLHGAGDYEGSGIGLAICRRVAGRYGGTITADGEPGAGATFTVRLPADVVVRRADKSGH